MTIELPSVPDASALYRRAITGLVKRRTGTGLPGTEFAVRVVAVDRDHAAAYARVCGFRTSDLLPATYPHVLAFPVALHLMSEPDFPYPVAGLVHISNEISQFRAVRADDVLDIVVRAEGLRPHDRGMRFDVVAVVSADGEEIWRGTSGYLRRTSKRSARDRGGLAQADPGQADPGQAAGSVLGAGGETAGGRPAGIGGARGGTAGEPTALWRVEASAGKAYAAVSGDRNPIHTSRLGARLFGFPKPIAHGMWTKARCIAALEGRLPEAYTIAVEFRRPILLPSTVGFRATEINPDTRPSIQTDREAGTEAGAGSDTGAESRTTGVFARATAAPPAWSISVTDPRTGRPHLTGRITSGPRTAEPRE